MIQAIINEICEHQNITLEIFRSPRRDKEIVLARQAFSYFMMSSKSIYKLSLKDCARYVNKEDHTTIMSSVKRFKRLLDSRDNAATTLVRMLINKFPGQYYIRGCEKKIDFSGFVTFKKENPIDDSLIELKNGIPFAIGFYDQEQKGVISHDRFIPVSKELEWRYYVV